MELKSQFGSGCYLSEQIAFVTKPCRVCRCDFNLPSIYHPSLSVSLLCAGTNVNEAKRILRDSGLPIASASNLEDAARIAVASVPAK